MCQNIGEDEEWPAGSYKYYNLISQKKVIESPSNMFGELLNMLGLAKPSVIYTYEPDTSNMLGTKIDMWKKHASDEE